MEYYHRFNSTIQEVFGGYPDSEDPDCHHAAAEEAAESLAPRKSLDEALIRLGDTYIFLKKLRSGSLGEVETNAFDSLFFVQTSGWVGVSFREGCARAIRSL